MKALIETTLFANALLKASAERKAARSAIGRFSVSLGPVYAFKELKAGPLKNFVWFHNKLAQNPYLDALRALHSLSRSLHRYRTSTAIEAHIAAIEAAGPAPAGMTAKYGAKATDPLGGYKDRLRLCLKRIIKQGWSGRRKLTTHVICELSCYPETPLTEQRDLTLEVEPLKCDVKHGCELARVMAADRKTVETLLASVETAERKPENERRARALRKLLTKDGWKTFSDKDCKNIGDAAFVFLAPLDATILTTNLRDMEPLAQSVSKVARRP